MGGEEHACPFCGAALPSIAAPPRLAVVLGLAFASCGPSVAGDDGGGSDADTSGTSSSSSSSSTSSTTTTGSSTAGTTTSTSSSGTESSTGTVDDSGDFVGGFYGGPVDGPTLPSCDVLGQDCPAGDKCMPYSLRGNANWDDVKCVPIAPDAGAVGDACTVEGSMYSGIDDCELGAICWDVDPETNTGTCVALCTGDWAEPVCEDPELTCSVIQQGLVAVCLP